MPLPLSPVPTSVSIKLSRNSPHNDDDKDHRPPIHKTPFDEGPTLFAIFERYRPFFSSDTITPLAWWPPLKQLFSSSSCRVKEVLILVFISSPLSYSSVFFLSVYGSSNFKEDRFTNSFVDYNCFSLDSICYVYSSSYDILLLN